MGKAIEHAKNRGSHGRAPISLGKKNISKKQSDYIKKGKAY